VTVALIAAPTATATAAPGCDAPLASAGWHGRPIRAPQPPHFTAATIAWPRGWSAGTVGPGAGFESPHGSRRVRDLQRRLRSRGYRTGPVDGRFGARTRSALQWFKIKHGLGPTCVADAVTVRVIRSRPRGEESPAVTAQALAGPEAVVMAAPATNHVVALLALAAAVLAGLAFLAIRLLGRRSSDATPSAAAPPPPAEAPAPEPPTHRRRVAGYMTVAQHPTRPGQLDDPTRGMAGQCLERGLELVSVVHDVELRAGGLDGRPGLAHVLERIGAGELEGIVAPRLRDLGGSAVGLGGVLRWLQEAGAFAVALDLGLDTSTPAGAQVANVLVEIGAWERSRIADRTRRGLAAARSGPNGAPGVRDDPELTARIVAMRADGLSLQAIADALNEQGVATLRGGREWRPSSVQAATGYKRPGPRRNGIEIPRPQPGAEAERRSA